MSRSIMLMLTAVLLLGGLAVGADSTVSQAQNQAPDLEADNHGRKGPSRASSYINPDIGLPTLNPNVKRNSDCGKPDQKDRQQVSPAGETGNNVHNDACLFRDGNRFDGKVSFEIDGRGTFNACPDPDGDGDKTGTIKNQGKRCYLTGYQESGGAMAGDLEYHARLNHTGQPGETLVRFCHDPNDNGCRDAKVKDSILITWVR